MIKYGSLQNEHISTVTTFHSPNIYLLLHFTFAHRKPVDVARVHQKPPSIFQLLDQLENVAEKLIAE
jgi:hypothetical protein